MWTEIVTNLFIFALGYLFGKIGIWYSHWRRRNNLYQKMETLRVRTKILQNLSHDLQTAGIISFSRTDTLDSLLEKRVKTLEDMENFCSYLEQRELDCLESIQKMLITRKTGDTSDARTHQEMD